MSTLDELRDLLAEQRDDPGVQRVFADALAQSGDPRGEVILRSLALVDGTLSPAQRHTVERELRELKENARSRWLPGAMHVELEHGLPIHAELSVATFVELGADAVLTGLPGLKSLDLLPIGANSAPRYATELQALLTHRLARSLRKLHLGLLPIFDARDHGQRRQVLDQPWPSTIALTVGATSIGVEELQVLFDHELPGLTVLTREVTPAVERVWGLRSTHLEAFTLTGTIVREVDLAAIIDHPALPRLASVGLTDMALPSAGLDAWANSAFSRSLRSLDLSASHSRRELTGSLLRAGPFDSLTSLSLRHCGAEVRPATLIEALPSSMPSLRHLDLRGVDAGAFGALMRSNHTFGSLRLSVKDLGPDERRQLVERFATDACALYFDEARMAGAYRPLPRMI